MKLLVKRLEHAHDLAFPHYATQGSAGLDLMAAIEGELVLAPGKRAAVPTGIAIELPQCFEAQVRPRSGLALNHGVTCLNTPGTIDSDYRGEVKVILINHGEEPFRIARGMKIAQMVIAAHEHAVLFEVDALTESERGAGGFGSTGMTADVAAGKS
ncbi:MAG: deoxyuridine 5'-triphosphate nucleotidohydrolase [Alphaproteobacteria bacterium 64-11]|nr:dUTP diphosphatase [Alphaproteobacteria bacterium]OJU12203.1 MAG: deoxyuridine 5'-triphosphate nucleotidohydrolase [Alphaproteobacteria bacterium 64-11]